MGLTGRGPSLRASTISSQLISVFACSTLLLPAIMLRCANSQSRSRCFTYFFSLFNHLCRSSKSASLPANSEATQLSVKCNMGQLSGRRGAGSGSVQGAERCRSFMLLPFSWRSVWYVGRQNLRSLFTPTAGNLRPCVMDLLGEWLRLMVGR